MNNARSRHRFINLSRDCRYTNISSTFRFAVFIRFKSWNVLCETRWDDTGNNTFMNREEFLNKRHVAGRISRCWHLILLQFDENDVRWNWNCYKMLYYVYINTQTFDKKYMLLKLILFKLILLLPKIKPIRNLLLC